MKVVKEFSTLGWTGTCYIVKTNDGKDAIKGPFATRSAARNWVKEHNREKHTKDAHSYNQAAEPKTIHRLMNYY